MRETAVSPILDAIGISKSFPGVKALDRVDLRLYPSTVTALIGENGAGKSTLVKILTGVCAPDAGRVVLNGKDIAIPDAEAAFHLGITATHQETVLFDELTVVENVFMGHPVRGRLGFLDWKPMRARTKTILEELEVEISPDTRLRDLGIARKHLIAIARALSVDAKIVIMDEPTASLSHKEVEELYTIIGKLKREGKAILFISHKFEEIFRIADRYAVLRDGQSVGEGLVSAAAPASLISLMVGRRVDQIFPKAIARPGETIFSVEGLSHPTEFADISFDIRKGEILGFYGLVGSGRSEVMQALFGVTSVSAGTVRLDGKPISVRKPADAIDKGIVYVPEERQRQGVVLALPVFQNITLPSLVRLARNGFLDLAREFDLARRYASRLDLRATSLSQEVGTLSGGNQQKVVVGKWLATEPRVIILDEPTKGIDVASKAAVHAFMRELAANGAAVVMVSSELPEILGMSERVIVMRQGRIVDRFDRPGLTAEKLAAAATGNVAAVAT
ncbi:MAG TPA: sugar ABC transporter ATP-binding protein [Terrimicrobiaceae bacterium]|nr:sugar ABC transporter ATP-binding protein [Terrimicrobiaceae bacterium]